MARKVQLRRLVAAFPGKPVQLSTECDNFGTSEGKPYRSDFRAYVGGTAGCDIKQNFASGRSYHEAVNNLIAANRSTSAGQEASSGN